MGKGRDGAEVLVPTSRVLATREGMYTTTAHGGRTEWEGEGGAEALVPTSRESAARGGVHTTTAHGGRTEGGGEKRRRGAGPDLA